MFRETDRNVLVPFFFSPFASRRDLPIKYVKNYESFLQSVRKYYRVSCGGYIHSYVPLPHSPIRIVQSAAAIYFATRKAELASIVTAPFLFSEAPNIVCGGRAVVKRGPVKMIEIFLFFYLLAALILFLRNAGDPSTAPR